MKKVEYVPKSQALSRVRAKRYERMREAMSWIQKLEPGVVGRVSPEEGEHLLSLYYTLKRAARAAGRKIKVCKRGDMILFWEER